MRRILFMRSWLLVGRNARRARGRHRGQLRGLGDRAGVMQSIRASL